MEASRVVEISLRGAIDDEERPAGYGSGYLIASNLILTARHVLGQARDPYDADAIRCARPLTSSQSDNSAWGRARAVWMNDAHDFALLEPRLDADAARSLELAPFRFGRITDGRPYEVCAVGFPRVNRHGTYRKPYQLRGIIYPLTAARGDPPDIQLLSPAPHDVAPDQPNPWAGMSGAALFVNDRLIGVVHAHSARWRDAVLTARLIVDAEGDSGFRHALERAFGQPMRIEAIVSTPEAEQEARARLKLLSILQRLLPSQFEEVLYLYGAPTEHLPSSPASPTERALALLRYAEQTEGPAAARLSSIICEVAPHLRS